MLKRFFRYYKPHMNLFLLDMGAFGFMFYFNPAMAVISLIPFPFMLLWGVFVGKYMKNGFRKIRKAIANINSSVENSMQGGLILSSKVKWT